MIPAASLECSSVFAVFQRDLWHLVRAGSFDNAVWMQSPSRRRVLRYRVHFLWISTQEPYDVPRHVLDRVRPPHGCQHTRPLHAHIILVSTGLYRPPRRSIFPCLIAIPGTNITILNERRCTMQSSLTTFPACPLQHMLLQWIRKEPFQRCRRLDGGQTTCPPPFPTSIMLHLRHSNIMKGGEERCSCTWGRVPPLWGLS
ncbi:hypothetical protein CPB85DRAFT_406000 [Mucidula mucida]|nr:hypothetical protein CPB85DRAFT_406000 [Mucidula mucida]